jgi:hypothetical protein
MVNADGLGKKCPQCGYARRANEPFPEDVCPQCGVVYWKVAGGRAPPEAAAPPSPAPPPGDEGTVAPVVVRPAAPRGAGAALRSPLVLGLVALVAAALLLKGGCWLSSHLRERERQRWLPLIASLEPARKKARGYLYNYGAYGKMRPPSGKVLIWSYQEEKPDSFGVTSGNLATTPEEVGTVFIVDKRWQTVGRYSDGAEALQHYADIFVIDAAGREAVYSHQLKGSPPPREKKGGFLRSGSKIDEKLTEWLSRNVGG